MITTNTAYLAYVPAKTDRNILLLAHTAATQTLSGRPDEVDVMCVVKLLRNSYVVSVDPHTDRAFFPETVRHRQKRIFTRMMPFEEGVAHMYKYIRIKLNEKNKRDLSQGPKAGESQEDFEARTEIFCPEVLDKVALKAAQVISADAMFRFWGDV